MKENQRLIERALEAKKNSYSPYSNFPVGAALQTGSGEIFTGTNIENGVNGLSICAERVALFKALSEGARQFEKLAVVCRGDYCKPCGACRQTLLEHAPELEVLMANPEGNSKTVRLKDLLPEAFQLGEED